MADQSPHCDDASEPAKVEPPTDGRCDATTRCLDLRGHKCRHHFSHTDYTGLYADRINDLAEALAAERASHAAQILAPHERSPEEKAALFPRLEVLSDALCQTEAFIFHALDKAGLTVVLNSRARAALNEVAK